MERLDTIKYGNCLEWIDAAHTAYRVQHEMFEYFNFILRFVFCIIIASTWKYFYHNLMFCRN